MSRVIHTRAGSPGYRIGRLFRANAALLARRLKSLPVRWGQVPLLMELLHQDGRTQEQLSREVRIDPAATTRALACLESSGLIRRMENPACRRDKLVYLTESANELLETLIPVLEEHGRLLLKGFSPEEARQALEYFDRMIRNVEGALDDKEAQS